MNHTDAKRTSSHAVPAYVGPLPNFFIVGAPKAGTTSLYHYLSQHPQLYMSPIKEPCYFASEIRPEHFSVEARSRIRSEMADLQKYLQGPLTEKRFGGLVTEWADYLRLFRGVRQEIAIGEASVCYLWSPTAPQNIASQIGSAKILIILRDPADRAFSQYLHNLSSGVARPSFREHIRQSLRRANDSLGSLFPFLELGLYFEQVQRYLETFGSQSVRVYIFEDDNRRMLGDILRFLEIDDSFVPDTSQRYLEPRIPRAASLLRLRHLKRLVPGKLWPMGRKLLFKSRRSMRMDPKDREYLVDFYKDDVRRLSGLLDRDLSRWLR